MTTKLMASVAFGGGSGDPDFTNDVERDFDLDPDLAAADLREAGYEVYLLPDKYHPRLAHPLDDFIEAVMGALPKLMQGYADERDDVNAPACHQRL